MRPDDLTEMACGAALLLALFSLTDRQRYVVVQRNVRGRTLQSIADELGTSRQAVSLSEKLGLGHLQRALSPLREELAA